MKNKITKAELRTRRADVADRITDLALVDGELSEEQRSELASLTNERSDLDRRLMALDDDGSPIAEHDPVFDDLAMRAQREGQLVTRALDGEPVNGAAGEYLTERFKRTRGVSGGVLVPWNWLDPVDDLQTRADSPTEAADVGVLKTSHRIAGRVFDMATATRILGLSPEGVTYGTTSIHYLTNDDSSGNIAAATAEGVRPETSGYGLTEREARPAEVSSAVDISRLAELQAGPEFEMRVINDLQMDMMDYFETQAVLNITTPLTDGTITGTAPSGFSQAVSLVVSQHIDGVYAADAMDLRVVPGVDVWRYLDGVYATATQDVSACAYIKNRVAGFATSAKVPSADNTTKIGQVIVRKGMIPESFRWWLWDAAELISDRISTGGRTTRLTLNSAYRMQLETDHRSSFALAPVRIASSA